MTTRYPRTVLIALGSAIGFYVGCMLYFSHHAKLGDGTRAGYALWGFIGAAILGFLSPITDGRIVSLLFLQWGAGSAIRRTTEADYSRGGAYLFVLGVFLALSRQWTEVLQLGGWQLYLAFPLTCILIFGWAPLLWKIRPEVIFPLGCLVSLLGFWRFYTFFTDQFKHT
jgi:hypothetical protein